MKVRRSFSFALPIVFSLFTHLRANAQPDVSAQIAFLAANQHPDHGWVRSYPDEIALNAYIYDQALAAIALLAVGAIDAAERILDRIRLVYEAAEANPPPGWAGLLCDTFDWSLPSTPLACDAQVGNNAWIVIAMNWHRARTGRTTYDAPADRILTSLMAFRAGAEAAPGEGSFRFAGSDPVRALVIASEPNLDCLSAFGMRGLFGGDAQWNSVAATLRSHFTFEGPPGEQPGTSRYWLNLSLDPLFGGRLIDAEPNNVVTDVQPLAVLALGPPRQGEFDYTVCLASITSGGWAAPMGLLNSFMHDGEAIEGFANNFRPGGAHENFVSLERTCQMATAFAALGRTADRDRFLNSASKAIGPDGGLICSGSDVDPTVERFPENFRKTCVAATAWFIFASLGVNPMRPEIRAAARHANRYDFASAAAR